MNKICFDWELPSYVQRLVGTKKSYSFKSKDVDDAYPSTSTSEQLGHPLVIQYNL